MPTEYRLTAMRVPDNEPDVVLFLDRTVGMPAPGVEPDWDAVTHYTALRWKTVTLYSTDELSADGLLRLPLSVWEDCVRRWLREEGQHVS